MNCTPLALVAGLGNPGSRYQATRHNAGFWFVEQVAHKWGGSFRAEAKFAAEVADTHIEDQRLRLLKPITFVNKSGQAVAALARFYRLKPAQILIVHDEIDLKPGVARLKLGGGPGGHNGLKDIIAHLGDRNFHRLRLGIGHPGQREEVVHFVLNRPSAGESKAIDEAIDAALADFAKIVAGDMAGAMNRLHRTQPATVAA
ncbi:MAG: aminoacyl-tRNA hydrolase [Gammaproteobacteria bacterium]|nr:aminoacyl-tRNA hydrolase [Gammaproteobacteria bacterium]